MPAPTRHTGPSPRTDRTVRAPRPTHYRFTDWAMI